jgi:hypothetical protein
VWGIEGVGRSPDILGEDSKKVSTFVGADNLFNVYPGLGMYPLAKG